MKKKEKDFKNRIAESRKRKEKANEIKNNYSFFPETYYTCFGNSTASISLCTGTQPPCKNIQRSCTVG